MLAFAWQCWRVLARLDWAEFLLALSSADRWPYLLLALLLMPLNWWLEARKWFLLLRPFLPWSFGRTWRATLAGVSLSAATPNRIGEIGGRLLVAQRAEWPGVLTSSVLGSACQWIAFLLLAWPGLVWTAGAYLGRSLPFGIFWLLPLGPALLLLGWWGGKPLVLRLLDWLGSRWGLATQELKNGLEHVNSWLMLRAGAYACLRFGVYCTQLYLLLAFFGLHLPLWRGLAGIAGIYLVQAGLPLPPGLNLVTRTELGLLLWGDSPAATAAVLLAFTSLFLVNVLVPALPGYWLIVKKEKTMNTLLRFTLLLALPLGLLTSASRTAEVPRASTADPLYLAPAFSALQHLLPAAAPTPFHPPMAVAPDVCEIENRTFQPGEKIVYKLYYNWNFVWLAAGEVTFLVHDLPSQYHVMVRGRTYPSYEWFYKVRDNYESYLDKKTLLPKIHIKDIHEGDYTRYDRTTFYQDAGKAISERGKTRNDLAKKEIALKECMHDLISIVYYARNLDYAGMKKNQEIPIKILMDQEIYPLKIKYLGAEPDTKIKGVGRFKTQKFSPQLIAGDVFKEGDEMSIYVSDDKNKIPVLIESPVSVGSVKAVLHSYQGLKYPMTAKLE